MDFEGCATMSAGQKDGRESSMDLAALGEIVERFAGKKIVLFGDFVADEFQSGEISRVSREAPVLILRHRATTVVPGGGANAANNLASLGAVVCVTESGLLLRKRDSWLGGRTRSRSKYCVWIASLRSPHRKRFWSSSPRSYKQDYDPRMR